VPVEQAFHLRTNSVRLSGAGQRAEGLRPERESTLPRLDWAMRGRRVARCVRNIPAIASPFGVVVSTARSSTTISQCFRLLRSTRLR